MKNKSLYLIVLIVIIGLVIWGVNLNSSNNKNEDPIKIGAALSLTGVAAQFGNMSKLAMEMAVEEINANGGINGRTVELYIEDEHTVSKDAVSAWRKLVDVNDVDAVVGGLFDFTAQPLFPLSENEQITFISPVNFVIEDTFEMGEHSFVMYPEFEKVIRELDGVISDESIKDMGMLRFQSDFGAEIERVLSQMLIEKGKNPLVTETYATIGGSDFRTPILKLKQEDVDTIFLDMLDFDIVTFLQRSNEQNFKPQIIGYTTIRDVIGKSDLIEGAIMLDWEVPSEEFVKRFEDKYGFKPERGNNRSYAAVYVLAEAIANSDNKADVSKYIENNSFETIDGVVEFADNNSVASTPVKVMRVEGGKLIEIK